MFFPQGSLWKPVEDVDRAEDSDAVPTYTYRCRACDAEVDVRRPIEDADTIPPCEDCGGEQRQVFGRVGVKLQGWGFSSTDGMVPDRPGRGSFREVAQRAERISDGG